MNTPQTEKELYIKEMIPGVYLLDEAHEATGYLVIGKEKACVIFGGTVKQHSFRCLPDKHYQQDDHVIVYDPDRL